MSDSPITQQAVLDQMREVITFGDRRYRLEHSGPITINISHTPTGLFLRYRDAFGTRPEELPDECSFQRGEHMFFTPMCRHDKHAYASEWFKRAAGGGSIETAWIALGTREYFARHYAEGEAPFLGDDRYLRVLFYQDSAGPAPGRGQRRPAGAGRGVRDQRAPRGPELVRLLRGSRGGRRPDRHLRTGDPRLPAGVLRRDSRRGRRTRSRPCRRRPTTRAPKRGRACPCGAAPRGSTRATRTSAFPARSTTTATASCARASRRSRDIDRQ